MATIGHMTPNAIARRLDLRSAAAVVPSLWLEDVEEGFSVIEDDD